jgi:hypothetical protein
MKARIVAVAILLIIIVAIGLYWYQTLTGVFHSTYSTGYEIKGIPVDELSITIGDYSTAKSVNMPNTVQQSEDYKYIIFPITVKNLASHTLYFDRQDDFTDRVNLAKASSFILTYGEKNYEAYAQNNYYMVSVPSSTLYGGSELKVRSLNWGWGITMSNAEEITSLAPNQSISGILYFVIGQYYNPNQLIFGSTIKPIFSINLNSK